MKFLGNLTFRTIGSDPEFFIVKKKLTLPSCMVLTTGRTKLFIGSYKIFKDNLLLEGNIPPATNSKTFTFNMDKLYRHMLNLINPIKAELISADAMKFVPRFLALPDAFDFGCGNYFNAWDTMSDDLSCSVSHKTPILQGPIRTAGFHIHLGLDYDGTYVGKSSKVTKSLKDLKQTALAKVLKFHVNRIITKLFELLVTNPSRHITVDKHRAAGYGSFGAFRMTPYGLECRSLGGHFTARKYWSWVADQSIRAVNITSTLINTDPDALIYFSKEVELKTQNQFYLDPSLYEKFDLDYHQELNSIRVIEQTPISHEKTYQTNFV